ncbi:MAG: bifunctional phosphopantothenoylcysteine decarboxylase/phosphopantothenate--cysteine ligase CoaBC [Candidatus Hinthialibacter antarcticus]|nr:bifunctional phosphopantothenoylcysteine decarboxylase/phosphopantothenate--cysteine ligase CoaBC [Candidatus Hinthialibacter antarcticus]
MKLNQQHILVGVTGGIAAYKTATFVRLLKKQGAEVRVIMTSAAEKFITPLTMATLSENEVGLDLFDQLPLHDVRHIHWAEWANLVVVAPATANTLAKAANGLADDLLSSTLLAVQCPLVMVPAMHHQMWTHPATQRNIKTLKADGVHIMPPAEGDLASGDVGPGRMPEPEQVLQFILELNKQAV